MRSLFLIAALLLGSSQRMRDCDIASLLSLHNKAHGSDFKVDLLLQEKAQDHADWMAKNKKLKHSAQVGYVDFGWTGENIARGYLDEKSVMKDWMDSKLHKANIVNKHFTHIGFGCAADDTGKKWWCVNFGGH